jgi:hypothetical protein
VLNEIRELCAILSEIKKQGLDDKELAKVKEKFSKQTGKKKKTEQELVDEVLDKKIKKEMEEKRKIYNLPWLQPLILPSLAAWLPRV